MNRRHPSLKDAVRGVCIVGPTAKKYAQVCLPGLEEGASSLTDPVRLQPPRLASAERGSLAPPRVWRTWGPREGGVASRSEVARDPLSEPVFSSVPWRPLEAVIGVSTGREGRGVMLSGPGWEVGGSGEEKEEMEIPLAVGGGDGPPVPS